MSPAMLPIIPKHIFGDSENIRNHPANMKPVGSGPFKLTRFIPGESVILERYENFFIPGRPHLDKIIIRLGVDPHAQMVEMTQQEAHLMTEFGNCSGLKKLEQIKFLVVTQEGNAFSGGINWLAFNLLRKPLSDIRVRQAIAYSIDVDFIIHYLYQHKTTRAYGPIVPLSPFYESNVRKYNYDLDKANQLLDEAGYPAIDGNDRFSLQLDHMPAIPTQQRDIAIYLKRQLKKVGIDIHIHSANSFSEWLNKIGNWNFDMTLDYVFNWGDPVIGVHRTYVCENIRKGIPWSNTQNYCNPALDKILAQAATEINIDKRKSLYRIFQKKITEDLPIIFINLGMNTTVFHTGLGNPAISLWGSYSPMDELYWKKLPEKGFLPIEKITQNTPRLKQIALQAMMIYQKFGLYSARKQLRNPEMGLLDLKNSGLHVIAVTDDGILILDNSGQGKAGQGGHGYQWNS
jgi:peptide/nickel transport system substrate-binding protein